MSRKFILNGVFSMTHTLSKKKQTENDGSPAPANTNISTERNLTL